MSDSGWGVDGEGKSTGRRRWPEVSLTGLFQGQMRCGKWKRDMSPIHSLKVVAFSNQCCLMLLNVGMFVSVWSLLSVGEISAN